MSLFSEIDDQIARRIDSGFIKIVEAVQSLADKLDLDSYGDMGPGSADKEVLLKAEGALAGELQHSIAERDLPEMPDPEIVERFLESYVLEGRYPDSVGPFSETWTSLPLKTLPLFEVRGIPDESRERAALELFTKFEIPNSVRGRIAGVQKRAGQQLAKRRRLLDVLRAKLGIVSGDASKSTTGPGRDALKAMFDLFFPGNPLEAGRLKPWSHAPASIGVSHPKISSRRWRATSSAANHSASPSLTT